MCIIPPLSRRAFSLIESAIVLGVVGLAIGGIWVAVATVNWRMSKLENVRMVALIIDSLRSDFANMTITTSGVSHLNDYILKKGIVTWPYANNSMTWLGLKTDDGKGFSVSYAAIGAVPAYPAQENRFTVSFGYNGLGAQFNIAEAECYFYLSSVQGYYGAINGHGNYYSFDDLTNPTNRKNFCNAVSGQLSLIFDR